MPVRPPQSHIGEHAYIPEGVSKTLSQQYANAVPAHLKQYVDSNHSGAVSLGMEKALTSAMEKNLPSYLKPYAEAYVRQNIVQPIVRTNSAVGSHSKGLAPPPLPDKLKLDHSMSAVSQYSVDPSNIYSANKSHVKEGNTDTFNSNEHIEHSPYDFILNPKSNQPKTSFNPFGGSGSLLKRIIVFACGLIVFIILFSIIKGVIAPGPNLSSFDTVAEDQTLILHLITESQQQLNAESYINIVSTIQLSVNSSRNELLSYLVLNHHKISNKTLSLKISKLTDTSLTSSIASGTFAQNFGNDLNSAMTDYQKDLISAYQKTNGVNGRKLLSNFYDQTKLVIAQLNATPAG